MTNIECPKCKSRQIKEVDTDFANIKPEGQPAIKKINGFNVKKYYCWNCKNTWIEKAISH